ncbi:VanZ family protein [Lachnoclostridium sp. An181]|uniref:VanZ family protein n=1 Tax=Lachnoclostridium sp. An181 TaxID=1965575 RepID=UPI000B3AC4E4|nr:VanZ family protein [Lachnoclostridium sp. An181]OUP50089.1 hypothetical protein B5F18_04610 [Lachnoclostridium sp. An181]
MGIVEEFFHTFANQIQTKAVWIFILLIPFTAGFIWLLKKRRTKFRVLNAKTIAVCVVFGGYMGALFALTLSGREIGSAKKSFEWEPLWSYREAIFEGSRPLGIEIVSNILLFVPFGILMPIFFRSYEKVKAIVKAAAFLSLAIEVFQGITAIGLFEIDDVINNVLGTLIGIWVWNVGRDFMTGKHRKDGEFKLYDK